MITKQTVTGPIGTYLRHKFSLAQLEHWAKDTLLGGEFAQQEMDALHFVVSRLGVADVRAFGLSRKNREQPLERLDYRVGAEILTVMP